MNDKGLEVIFDSGYTIAVSSFKEDFIGEVQSLSKAMQGLGTTIEVVEKGTIQWNFRDDYGVNQPFKVEYLLQKYKRTMKTPLPIRIF